MKMTKLQLLGVFTVLVFAIMIGVVAFDRPQAFELFKDCDTCPEMVVIPAGSFQMGSHDGPDDERPLHQVTIEDDFTVGKHEVTRDQFREFVESSGYVMDPGCEIWGAASFNVDVTKNWSDPAFVQSSDHPVVCVNWMDAQSYVSWLRDLTGEQYRLLSEPEWEYVARAGSKTDYTFGDHMDATKANFGDAFKGTTAVGSYPENGFHLHDLHGNAAEWVADCLTDNYDDVATNGQTTLNEACDKMVVRGGNWNNAAEYLRSAFRTGYFPSFRFSSLGFRIARDL